MLVLATCHGTNTACDDQCTWRTVKQKRLKRSEAISVRASYSSCQRKGYKPNLGTRLQVKLRNWLQLYIQHLKWIGLMTHVEKL